MENKPNQHYVWQKYLEPWTTDKDIVCLRNKKVIFRCITRNIASQRYFYKINDLTETDYKLIRAIFINNKPEPMKILLQGWIKPIEDFFRICKAKENLKTSSKELIDLELKNLLEGVHMYFEYDGIPGLNKLQNADISFLQEISEEAKKFILYLCVQYTRTKKMKESIKDHIGKDSIIFNNFDDAINLIVIIAATQIAESLIYFIKDKECYCYLLENESEIQFITGDQPVINTLASFDKNVATTDLELYYPISPSLALLITKEQNHNTKCSSEEVKKYNDMIEHQSLELIFSKEESILHTYKLD